MTVPGWIQIALFLAVLTAITPLLGAYLHKVFRGDAILDPVLGRAERGAYRWLRVDPEQEHDWKGYARAVLLFSLISWLGLYAILRTQGIHPFNPAGSAPARPTSASTPPRRSVTTPSAAAT